MLLLKSLLVVTAALGAATLVCPSCETVVARAAAQSTAVAAQVPDTATARLHISGMTCATCPVTARLALQKLAGVYEARVTLDDSLGVVRYDPRLVSVEQITSHLTKLTGYKATVLPDSGKAAAGFASREHSRKGELGA